MNWVWESIAESLAARPVEVLRLVNRRMKALENFLGEAFGTFSPSAKIYTTDATVTTLTTEAIPVSASVAIVGDVLGRRTGGSAGTAEDAAAYRVQFVAKNTAGTAALIGSGTVTVIGESQAAWDVTLSASGGGIRIRVTGAANNTITWVWTRRSLSATNTT